MTTLISPGTTVRVDDQSFYIPATASTVPLIVGATVAQKKYNDVDVAVGTQESGVVRTLTSLGESIQTYGIPTFRESNPGSAASLPFHGDALNEYGVLALNQYLRDGSMAYFVRADVDLANKSEVFYSFAVPTLQATKLQVASYDWEGMGTGTITGFEVSSTLARPDTYTVVFTSAVDFTLTGQRSGYLGSFTLATGSDGSKSITVGTGANTIAVASAAVSFTISQAAEDEAFVAGDYIEFATEYMPYSVSTPDGAYTVQQKAGLGYIAGLALSATYAGEAAYLITMTGPTSFTVSTGGVVLGTVGTVGQPHSVVHNGGTISFTVTAGSTAYVAGVQWELRTKQMQLVNPLGATDADRRAVVVAALKREVLSNLDLRSTRYTYNLLLCPGYPEVAQALVDLATSEDAGAGEVFVISETPMNLNPSKTVAWASQPARVRSNAIAYYYPAGLVTNLDGKEVVGSAAGLALMAYVKNDNMAEVWDAPMGPERGVLSTVSNVGYVSGVLGTPTTFVPLALNKGQCDSLYKVGTDINPIVYFDDAGIQVNGQKTSASVSSALDRVNVQRLIMKMIRDLKRYTRIYVGKRNSTTNRKNMRADITAYCADLVTRDALYDFAVYCDTTNNTATTIDRNELHAKVAFKPVKTVEFVYIDLVPVNTGDSLK